MDIVKGNMGWIEVVVGPMFSGKSEELIRRLRRAEFARQRVQIFKPAIDERYSANEIVSHSGLGIQSECVNKASEVMAKVQPRTEVVGIDEAQFLGEEIVDVCTQLANLGKRVIVAGLDQDYAGKPFDPMPQLLAVAEYITKTLAICMVCGAPANRTYRKKRRAGRVVVGGTDLYEARCRRCYELGRRAVAPTEEPRKEPSHAASPHASRRRRRRRAGGRPRVRAKV